MSKKLFLLLCVINFSIFDCFAKINKSPSDLFLSAPINDEPIIGILAEEMTTFLQSKYEQYHSYIAASYVKFIEGSGARVVPVW